MIGQFPQVSFFFTHGISFFLSFYLRTYSQVLTGIVLGMNQTAAGEGTAEKCLTLAFFLMAIRGRLL